MRRTFALLAMGLIALLALWMLVHEARAWDNGQYKNSPLKSWFDSLKSGHGLCCSFADGRTVSDPDWGMEGGHYWVVVDGKKLIVPDDALVNVPNKFGQAVVWPYKEEENGPTLIRCFMAGAAG